eukprot:TRINITY_DN916_c0_g1_i2.p1 TRINITY_DN916_c0_g1~~TRINITY_DN916_c0_g1_i2.p1  ORF type:complete len:401 (+),score=32.44 TRINITY_DN916_c0_g1_i2:45-1247(+)
MNTSEVKSLNTVIGASETDNALQTDNENSLVKASEQKAFGKPTIGFWGSFILTANNIMGPAMVAYPSLYQSAGWFSSTALLILIYLFSSFSATMLCEAMQRIPNNENFSKRWEFANVIKHYYGKKAYVIGQLLLNICLVANCIASIIVSAQVMDDFLIFAFSRSFAFEFDKGRFIRSTGDYRSATPFDNSQYVVSLGYIICMTICIPFGWLNLEENMWFQWFSFVALVLTYGEFIIQFFLLDWHSDYCPMFGNGLEGQAQVLGIIVFSYAFVITVPSWVNEKKRNISVNPPIWLSTTLCAFLKFSVGFFGALSYRNPSNIPNILTVMTQTTTGSFRIVTKISVYLFNFGTIVPGIPVFSILIRYNLITGGICGPIPAFLIGVVAPWLVSMFLYQGAGFRL